MAEGSPRGHSAIFLSPRASELRDSVISYGSDQIDGALVVPSDVPVSHHGTLQKIGRKLKLWKSRYFEVQGQQMYYYKSNRKRHCLGLVDLKNCYHVEPSDTASFGYAFEVQTVTRTHLFAARTEEERQKWIGIITENMGGKAVYEASKSTLAGRTKTGRRLRGERNRTVDSVPFVQAGEEGQPQSPTTMTPQAKRQSRMSKLITRMTSFKGGKEGRPQRPVSYTPQHSKEPSVEFQKPPEVQKEQTVQVEVAPTGKDTAAAATAAKEDSVPPNIVVKEPTPEASPLEGTPPREVTPPPKEGSPLASESGSRPVDENHVEPCPQAEEPHPQVERTEAKPHPLQATHTAPRDREPSAPRDEPAVHVEENTPKETAAAATTAVENHEEEAGLREKDTTIATPLSAEDTAQRVDEHTASPAGAKNVATTREPPPTAIASAASHSPAKPSAETPTKPRAETPTKPRAETPTKPSSGVNKFVLQSELPAVPTVPALPAEVREYLSKKFAADSIKEHLAALPSEGEEPTDLPLPLMYRSFSFSSDHEDDIAPSMNEMRLFLANCA